jgi:lipid II:glycine glycyltransferase (peptidoglycan interpeptide bridge formation enzyme)
MTQTSKQSWGTFLDRFPSTHILQSFQWGELKSRFGWEVSRLTAGEVGAQILFRKLPLGLRLAYIPKGPVGRSWGEIWPLVDRECQRRRVVFLKVEPDIWEGEPAIEDLSSSRFQSSEHLIQPPRTLLIDLKASEDEILSRMKQKTRYNIRLAAKKGVKLKYSDDIKRFSGLMELTGERNEFGVHSYEYYQAVYDLFAPLNACELIFAEYENLLLAAVFVFRFGDRAWYFYGASSDQYRNLMAPYAVQWQAIRWARSQGCLTYDLWGVPDEEQITLEQQFMNRNDGLWGVYRFKRGFGGELKRSIGAWDRVYNPILYLIYRFWMKKFQF